MSIDIPHFTQEKGNTCALACLRMVLAAYGTQVDESELEGQARLEPLGTPIDDLVRLAQQYGLVADIQDATVEELQGILDEGKLPIAYIDRAVFDLTPRQRERHSIRNSIIHNVIPTQVSAKSVTLHDPRQPQVIRKTIRLFRQAFEGLGGRCVICSMPEEPDASMEQQVPSSAGQ